MLTIGWKQIILILVVGFLLFGNFPKRQKELKDFFSSSEVKEDLENLKEKWKESEKKKEG